MTLMTVKHLTINTIGTFFSGGGGFDIGAVAAGWEPVFANEYDKRIAAVYRQNLGDHITVGSLLDLDVKHDFPRVRWFHASPPCPNFSVAKASAEESANDLELARQTARYIVHHLPDFVTLENVYGYRKSKSWRIIARALNEHGYLFNYWHVNMADYGVPQTRQRMIVVARRDGAMPMLPPATHAENPAPTLFGDGLKKWIGWYEVIEDLIPTLPDSQFADWQLERLIVASLFSKAAPPRAFLLNETPNNHGATVTSCAVDAPAFTMTASVGKRPLRALLMDAGNVHRNGQKKYRSCDEPTKAITASDQGHRAYTNGRVVKMTPRALARFQSFPDTYQLPENNSLACRIIGNAVPPLFAQRLGEWLR